MPQPRTLGAGSRYSPVEALRILHARLQGVRDPPAVGAALVEVLADVLGDPPVGLFLADPNRGGFVLRAATGLPTAQIDGTRLAAEVLPAALRPQPAAN